MQRGILASVVCFLGLSFTAACNSGVHNATAQTARSLQSSTNTAEQETSKGVHLQAAGSTAVTYRKNPERFVKLPTYQAPFNIKNPRTADEHFDVAIDADNRRDFAMAIREYELALAERPEWAIAHFRLAQDLSRAGREHDAIRQWDQAIRISPQLYAAYDPLARAYESVGDLTNAIETYSKLLALAPTQIAALYQQGVWYQKLGDRRHAREKFEQYRAVADKDDSERSSARYQAALKYLRTMK